VEGVSCNRLRAMHIRETITGILRFAMNDEVEKLLIECYELRQTNLYTRFLAASRNYL